MKKAAIYVKHKLNASESAELKIAQCQEFAKSRHLEVVRVYCDRVTDNTQKRYDFESLLKDCKKHLFDYVIITYIASVSRKFNEVLKFYKILKENSIELFTVDDENELIKAIISIGASE